MCDSEIHKKKVDSLLSIIKAFASHSFTKKRVGGLEYQSCNDLSTHIDTRALDTLARLMQIRSECAAVRIEKGSNRKISKLYLSFNSSTPAKEISQLQSFLQKHHENSADAESLESLKNLMLNNKLHDFNRNMTSLIQGLNSKIKLYNNEQKQLGYALKLDEITCLTKQDTTKTSLTKLENIIDILKNNSEIVQFIKKDPKVAQTADLLFKSARAYIDWYKFINLILPNLDIKDGFLEIVENKAGLHAEIAIVVDAIEKGKLGDIKYIGISKLSCYLCYSLLEVLGLKNSVRGSHMTMVAEDWKMPNIELTQEQWKKLIERLETYLPMDTKLKDIMQEQQDSHIVNKTYLPEFSDDDCSFDDGCCGTNHSNIRNILHSHFTQLLGDI